MRKSSSIYERIESLSALDHGPEHGHSSPGEGDQGLRVMFPLASFAVVEGFGQGVFGADGAERALEEDAFESFVSTESSSPCSLLARLPDHRGKASGSGQRIGRGEAPDVSDTGDELCHKHRPHPRQGLDEGTIRVGIEQQAEIAIDTSDLRLAFQCLDGQLADQFGDCRFARHGQGLGACGDECLIGQTFGSAQMGCSSEIGVTTRKC